jgi:hypothetical protein
MNPLLIARGRGNEELPYTLNQSSTRLIIIAAHTISDPSPMIRIFDLRNSQYNSTLSDAQNNVMLWPFNWMGAVNEIKLNVIPISKYRILLSIFRFLNKTNEAARLKMPREAVNNPLYSPAFAAVNKYKPAAKYAQVFASRIPKSELMNFLFSRIL